MILMNRSIYESPLSSRYASDQMQYIFSPDKKFSTWRRLWVALARAEMELGLPVHQEQVDELEAHITDIDYNLAAKMEKRAPSRCNGAHPRLWDAVSKGNANHPLGRYQLLCGGQHGHYHYA